MKKLLLTIASAALLLVGASAVAAGNDMRIGTLDMQQVFSKTDVTTQFQGKLQTQFGERMKKFGDDQQNIAKLTDQLRDKDSKLTDKEKEKLKKQIKAEQTTVLEARKSFRQELRGKQVEEKSKLQDTINKVVQKIAKDKNLNLVLKQDTVIFIENSIDITQDVIKALQKDFPKKS